MKEQQMLLPETVEELRDIHEGKPSTIYLMNGIKLNGVPSSFSRESVRLTRDGVTQTIMCQAIATIVPMDTQPKSFEGRRQE